MCCVSFAIMDVARISSRWIPTVVLAVSMILISSSVACAGDEKGHDDLDARVEAFLAKHRHSWRDMNVPMADGQLLHDLVVEGGYTRALEIGTSTGHSGIWIAWALAKTGGLLITVELDERRYREALANFEEAGLSDVVDARLADAHVLVSELEGPFDFVFVDADKDWYVRYFEMVLPKLEAGGCFTAHNVTMRRVGWVREFLEVLHATPGLETEINDSGNGLSVSYFRKGAE